MRIPDKVLDSSLYLYASTQAAQEGSTAGGSGFLVHFPLSIDPHLVQVYVVTNKHVLDAGFGVLRFNKTGGGIETIETQREQWTRHPDGLDVEVMPFDPMTNLKWNSLPVSMFVNSEILSIYNIGIGDDAFVVGRLVNHEGRQRNAPIVRFGTIALMADPQEPIRTGMGEQEAFLVECRSLSGFSGSPVFLTTSQDYFDEAAQRVTEHRQTLMGYTPSPEEKARFRTNLISGTHGPWLLGIDCGHIPHWSKVRHFDSETGTMDGDTELRAEANSGIAVVLPAWQIMTVLSDPELVKLRKEEERKFAREMRQSEKTHEGG